MSLQAGDEQQDKPIKTSFVSDGLFDGQLVPQELQRAWQERAFNKERWWGDFPKDQTVSEDMFEAYPWAIGPFEKYADNPILAPTAGSWDQGHLAGGVHNGALVRKDNKFYYVYRGEQPIDVETQSDIKYICDIGIAVSADGVQFTKDDIHSPLFRKGPNRRYSYEDVCLVKHETTYFLFCNQWLWEDSQNPRESGVFLATSPDLMHWDEQGIVFPEAKRIHRNPVVLQNPQNEAVRVGGRFIMYINDGLMAYSDDMHSWESVEIPTRWPGGEGCFAVTDHNTDRPDDIVLFTGGHHTGHFYAIGEVLFSRSAPTTPLDYLPHPVMAAEKRFPYEDGFSADGRGKFVSCYPDTVFFNGLTRHDGRWLMVYGGSEYYSCLATWAP
ncbi:MAG: hypothetical protein MK171_07330 [Pirellulales bacterium]|nr:hypothetical protein [Pirellulales bacterium]